MEERKPPAEPEVVNPRYAGATFGDVARALAKPVSETDEEGVETPRQRLVPPQE